MMRDLAREGYTILAVTHEMGFARAVADRIVFLADGRVVEDGTSDAVFGAPKTEAARGRR